MASHVLEDEALELPQANLVAPEIPLLRLDQRRLDNRERPLVIVLCLEIARLVGPRLFKCQPVPLDPAALVVAEGRGR